MGAKHNKCCCPTATCLIGSDNFDRADSDSVGSLWTEVSGDFDISANTLITTTAGLLITTLRQTAPVDSANYSYVIQFKAVDTATAWKVVCKFTDANNFDWIEIFDSGGGNYKPKFWRRSGGSDTLLVDPVNYPMGGAWTIPTGGLTFTICYSSLEWSVSGSLGSFNWSFCLANPATSLPASPHGFVGFIDGDFDDFAYYIHYESNNTCDDCTCYCWDGTSGKCIPETLTLTLTPVVEHADCVPLASATTHTFTMRQSLPTEPVSPPPTYRKNPMKQYWYSDPVITMEPVNDPHPLWFRLECLGNGLFELICMSYPSGAETAPAPMNSNIIQFADTSGTNGGSPVVTVDCSPIILTFSRLVKTLLQIGSGGPFTCNPFNALEYSAIITEAPPVSPLYFLGPDDTPVLDVYHLLSELGI